MTVIFPDIEKELVTRLTDLLANVEWLLARNVRVATRKVGDGSKQVIVTGSYNETVQEMIRAGTAVIDVYAPTYSEASDLALLVGALAARIPGDYIKRSVVNLGPIRVVEEGMEEQRTLTVDLTVRGLEI